MSCRSEPTALDPPVARMCKAKWPQPGPGTAQPFRQACEEHRPVTWPPEEPERAVTVYFDQLSAVLAVNPRAIAAARERREVVASMVGDALRPHCLDVDVLPCGSYASGTAVAASTDIDLAVRVWSEPESWEGSPQRALAEVKRWLSYSCEKPLQETKYGVRMEFDDEGPNVQLLLFLPHGSSRQRGPSLASNHPVGDWLCADPPGHAALIRARNVALGHSRFAKTLRLIKQLAGQWELELDRPVVSSYVLEALALDYFRAPFALPEGVAGFLSFAADAGQEPVADPAGQLHEVDDPASFAARCRDASAQVAGAVVAELDPAAVIRHLFSSSADRATGIPTQ